VGTETLIELDARRRLSFGKIGRNEHTRYLVKEYPDGSVMLTPAVVMSETEARFWSDPEFAAHIERRRATGRTVRRSVPDLDDVDPLDLEF
jgi:hypothetical protein